MTVEFSMSNNLTMINRLIIVLGRKFCLSTIPNVRKGGLLGLAAVMVGFKNGSKPQTQPPIEIVEECVRPILTCFLDSDSRVRYYACESLYNVTKVAEANILPIFDSIFDNMAKVVADPDIGVRSGAEVLDGVLRDIVGKQASTIQDFVPKLKDYIYTKNPFTRMFILDWIKFLYSNKSIDMMIHLPQLLDGILNCLYDSTEVIKAYTLSLLSEFLNNIVGLPTDRIQISLLTEILLKHASNNKEWDVQYTAIAWLRQFISLMNDEELIRFTPGILKAILPCLAIPSTPEGTDTISSMVNSLLLQQVTAVLANRKETSTSTTSDLEPILEVLIQELQKQEHPVIKLAILDWIKKLIREERDLIFVHTLQHELFQILLDTLSAPSDAVVKNALQVIADIFCFDGTDEQQVVTNEVEESSVIQPKEEETTGELERKKSPAKHQPILQKGSNVGGGGGSAKKVAISTEDSQTIQQRNANISRFIQALCKTFRDKESIFKERVTFIVVNLCNMVKPAVIYKSFAEILKEEKADPSFAYNMVQKLNQILLTTQDLYILRCRLSNDDDSEMASLFHTLYHAWCHSPIAALTLCLLTNNYRLASEIVMALSQTDVNLGLLKQIDWLVHLIESPIFASLRMKLLDSSNHYLHQCLYGILMILPQSEAYHKLGNRLDQVYKFASVQSHMKLATVQPQQSTHKPLVTPNVSKEPKKVISTTSLEALMKHYLTLQNQRLKLVSSSENDE